MSVVVRRFFGPVVPIQSRDDWKCSTRGPLGDRDVDPDPPEAAADPPALEPPDPLAAVPPEPAPDEPPAADPPELAPVAAPVAAPAVPVAVCVADDAVVCVWFVTLETGGGGVGRGGGAGVVTGGGAGSGTVTGRVVVVGKVGGGGRSIARATVAPATRPKPATRTPNISRIPEQLRSARFGCGFRRIGNNSGQMALIKRDYYEVLGVSRNADDETIKRAFHELARDWHPDVADAPEAEARFRELAEAYSVLSRRESRVLYDRYGYRGRGDAAFDEMVPADVARGENIHADLELRSFEAEAGTRRIIAFHAIVRCPSCMGSGTLEPDPEPCPQCEGRGTVETERRLRLRIPPGAVDDGSLLRVAGDGNDAGAGSVPGDLLVRVRVLPPPKDPRSVRYIAVGLLLVAIVALVLYLIR